MREVYELAREEAQLNIALIGLTAIYSLDALKLRLFLASLQNDELDELRSLGAVGKVRLLQRLFDAYLSHPSGRC
jgi:hypothetical protein